MQKTEFYFAFIFTFFLSIKVETRSVGFLSTFEIFIAAVRIYPIIRIKEIAKNRENLI